MIIVKENRVLSVLENMKKAGIPQLIVSQPASVFYLTGKWIMPGERMLALYLNDSGTVMLFANRLFALSGNVDAPLTEFDDTEDCVSVLSAAVKPGKIGIDKFWPSQFTIRLMEKRPDVVPVVGSVCVDDARMIKDAEELRLMRVSSLKNDAATEKTIAAVREGIREDELAALHTRFGAEDGCTGASFEPLVCFGANCAEPHHSTDRTVIRSGDSVIIDVGLVYESYSSDMTRTVFFGGVTDEQKRVYDLVRKANEAGRAAARPGIPLCEIDRAARRVIEDGGYGKYFIHRTGHGIGLNEHEYPDVSLTSEVIAKPGMVFSVEPGIYLPGRFGVRIEDLVAVTEDGAETLNRLPRELVCL